MQEGLIEFTPCYLRQFTLLFSEGYYPVDVAVVQLAPPNDGGYCSCLLVWLTIIRCVMLIDIVHPKFREEVFVVEKVHESSLPSSPLLKKTNYQQPNKTLYLQVILKYPNNVHT